MKFYKNRKKIEILSFYKHCCKIKIVTYSVFKAYNVEWFLVVIFFIFLKILLSLFCFMLLNLT